MTTSEAPAADFGARFEARASKLVISYLTGPRDGTSAFVFAHDIKEPRLSVFKGGKPPKAE